MMIRSGVLRPSNSQLPYPGSAGLALAVFLCTMAE